ncbi:hypothetical protein QFC22_003501 [Naganishia vaughanmartiniae]|uniref:Uncharacterized protein n=1 Tax=Naganishia vaughanmartiniae TaxID=1424756 RepID=A0ACC2X8C5_9TREE|nr:hypothetical protein QFC22_003501 [Naganishia vaughanmartiniae]
MATDLLNSIGYTGLTMTTLNTSVAAWYNSDVSVSLERHGTTFQNQTHGLEVESLTSKHVIVVDENGISRMVRGCIPNDDGEEAVWSWLVVSNVFGIEAAKLGGGPASMIVKVVPVALRRVHGVPTVNVDRIRFDGGFTIVTKAYTEVGRGDCVGCLLNSDGEVKNFWDEFMARHLLQGKAENELKEQINEHPDGSIPPLSLQSFSAANLEPSDRSTISEDLEKRWRIRRSYAQPASKSSPRGPELQIWVTDLLNGEKPWYTKTSRHEMPPETFEESLRPYARGGEKNAAWLKKFKCDEDAGERLRRMMLHDPGCIGQYQIHYHQQREYLDAKPPDPENPNKSGKGKKSPKRGKPTKKSNGG